MMILLSPAKTLNMEKTSNTDLCSQPVFIKEAGVLMKELCSYSPPEMESLLKINSELAERNFVNHINWNKKRHVSDGKQAILAYNGAVYQGLRAHELNEKQLFLANDHIRILSGLYGVLRPLDMVLPYRLEMGTKLKNKQGNNLYCYWNKKLTDYFKEEICRQDDNLVIDLASKEYSTVINSSEINARIITPMFKDYKNGKHKIITIYTKRARGLMTRFIIENNITNSEELKEFYEEGYSYNEYMSNDSEWVFTR